MNILNLLWVFFQYLNLSIFGKCDKHEGFQFYYISFQSNKILYNQLKLSHRFLMLTIYCKQVVTTVKNHRLQTDTNSDISYIL